jgi:metal-responsive CopG/Arc/MetJ family transcriptional regulator
LLVNKFLSYNSLKEVINLPSEKPFIALVVEESLLKRIDDYRFEKRFPSRAAAIKTLLEIGLKQEENQKERHP